MKDFAVVVADTKKFRFHSLGRRICIYYVSQFRHVFCPTFPQLHSIEGYLEEELLQRNLACERWSDSMGFGWFWCFHSIFWKRWPPISCHLLWKFLLSAGLHGCNGWGPAFERGRVLLARMGFGCACDSCLQERRCDWVRWPKWSEYEMVLVVVMGSKISHDPSFLWNIFFGPQHFKSWKASISMM